MNSQSHLSPSIYVGLDVHKDSLDIAIAEAGRDGQVRHLGTVAGGVDAVSKSLRRLVCAGHRLHVVYEAALRSPSRERQTRRRAGVVDTLLPQLPWADER